MDHDAFFGDESLEELWDLESEDLEPLERPWWRGPLLIGVAAVTAIALAIVPLYNVFWSSPRIADNGLEICGLDYCIVQDAVTEFGLGDRMSFLSNTFLTEEQARAMAGSMTDYLDISPVGLVVVTRLDGDLDGRYDPATRVIEIESPATAWTVAHEVAHAVAGGHGEEFQRVLIDLASWLP